ncbi:hypothetical protein [Enterococcus casseliflavus]|uniref:hypothetical protein n=1 Tax=Enterococcus casseliflavus TaxID=37734 RepID=UPI003BBEB98D
MEDLTIIERSVLELIPRGFERKIKVPDICSIIDLEERDVKTVIQMLRSKGVPIVSVRGYEGGMFIAITEEERQIGLRAFRSQFKSMEKTIRSIENADLFNWSKVLIPNEERKDEVV